MIWNPLAAAYDAEYEALEAARQMYHQAVAALLEEVRAAWSTDIGHEMTAAVVPSSQPDWNCVRGQMLRDGACIGVYGWVGAASGGPAGTFRLGVYVAEGPYTQPSAYRGAVVQRALTALNGVPGRAYDPARDVDSMGGDNLVRLDTVAISSPFDAASFRTALVAQTRELIHKVAIPVADAFTKPVIDARALLRDVAVLLAPMTEGRGTWEVQGLAPWAGSEVVGIEDDDRAVYLGLDPIRRRLFLNARRADPLLIALRDERHGLIEKSPYTPTIDEVLWIGSIDEPLPDAAGIAELLRRWLA